LQRKAWQALTKREKLAYLDATKCLMKLPATYGFPGTRTRFDELQAVHIMQAEWTHEVGAFLPFHRFLMHTHEKLMRDECGYKGAQPYWYEQIDAGRVNESALLDPVYGFGGAGTGPNNCIEDGPFKDYINPLGPGHEIADHCISRNFNVEASWWMAQSFIDYCRKYETFADFWWCAHGASHLGGHGAIGGTLRNAISSPGDPLFYLHHTFLDKVWSDWQLLSPSTRIFGKDAMGGTNRPNPCNNVDPKTFISAPRDPASPLPYPPWPKGTWVIEPIPGKPGFRTHPGLPEGFGPARGCVNGTDTWGAQDPYPWPGGEGELGDGGKRETTMGHILSMLGMVENVTIADVMDTKGGYLCYEYV